MKTDAVTNIIIFFCLVFCIVIVVTYPPRVADDATIYQAIQAKLTANPFLSQQKIGVYSSQGLVKLSGILDSEQEAIQAMAIAKSTAGVRGVNASELLVEEQAASK